MHFTLLPTSCKYYITLSLHLSTLNVCFSFLFFFFFLPSPLDVNSNVNWQVNFISFLLFLFSLLHLFLISFILPLILSVTITILKQTECLPTARAPTVTYQVLLHVCIMSLTSSRFTSPDGKRWRPVTQGWPCG